MLQHIPVKENVNEYTCSLSNLDDEQFNDCNRIEGGIEFDATVSNRGRKNVEKEEE